MWCILAFWTFFVKNFFFYDSYFMTKIMIFTFNLILKKLSTPLHLTKKYILFLKHLYVWNHKKVDTYLYIFDPKLMKTYKSFRQFWLQPISGRHLHDSALCWFWDQHDSAKVKKLFWPLSVPRSSFRSNPTSPVNY